MSSATITKGAELKTYLTYILWFIKYVSVKIYFALFIVLVVKLPPIGHPKNWLKGSLLD